MATIIHNDLLNSMLGNPTHSVTDFDTDTVKLSLLDQTDSGTITASFVDYDEVDAATVVAVLTVANKTVGTLGVGIFDSTATQTFTTVSGDTADYLTLWKDSGTPATSPLAVTWDSATTGLPVIPNGGNIDVTPHATNGWLKVA